MKKIDGEGNIEIENDENIHIEHLNMDGMEKKGKIKIIINKDGQKEVIEEEFDGEMSEEMKQKMAELHKHLGDITIDVDVDSEKPGDHAIFFKHCEEGDKIKKFDCKDGSFVIKMNSFDGAEMKAYNLGDGEKVMIFISKVIIITDGEEEPENQVEEGRTEENNDFFTDFNLYPNPNDGKFNLDLNFPEKGNTTIQIYDWEGGLVFQDEMRDFSGNYTKNINLGTQKRGVYILRITQNDNVATKQIKIE